MILRESPPGGSSSQTTVLFQKQFRGAQLSVVVVTHRKTMRACIMNDKEVSHINLRKHAVNCEFIIVLAQGTGYIVLVVTRASFSFPITVMWWYAPYIAGRIRLTAQASQPIYSL